DVGGEIGLETLFGGFESGFFTEGEDEAGSHADDGDAVLSGLGFCDEGVGRDGLGLHGGEADGLNLLAAVEERLGNEAAGSDDVRNAAIFEAVENGDVGTPAGAEETSILEAKDARGGVAGGAIDMVQRAAHGDEA